MKNRNHSPGIFIFSRSARGMVAVGFICARLGAAADQPKASDSFAPVKLRGYGEVSGSFSQDANGSNLAITCESEAKARLLHAKYLSDLAELPGVTTGAMGGQTVEEVASQGAIAAYCAGNKVRILAATSDQKLQALIKGANPSGTTTPQTDVPMYLDRWDKYGFRFYYWPFHLQPGVSQQTYDFAHDFDYAEAQHRSGYVFWDNQNEMDSGEAVMSTNAWDWARLAASARHLPIAINGGSGFDHEGFWFYNKYPEAVQQRMPDFCGSYRSVASPYDATAGALSWNADDAFEKSLGLCQASYAKYTTDPSVVSFLEPHGELYHSPGDILMEYGPTADAGYRKFLQGRYGTISALSQRWFGNASQVMKWDDVHVPELASFLGWNKQAIDLAGEWAVNYELPVGQTALTADDLAKSTDGAQPATQAPPAEWFQPQFDDSSWPRIRAPGTDETMFIPHRPAVYRRTFQMNDGARQAHPRWWLYVWDLNTKGGDHVFVYLNGKKINEGPTGYFDHWAAIDVTDVLAGGLNQLSLRLPQGVLGYRVYLSPDEPKQYPQLGPERNAQWVDLIDWTSYTRVHQVDLGLQMIRQIDPNRQVTLMAPNHYADGVRSLAEKYGAEFHDTGFMGVCFSDQLSCLMNGADLPFSAEPGGPADDVMNFKHMWGLYFTEGVQGVDYFIHEGDILYHDDIRKNFEDNANLYHLVGKFHAPKGDLAVLFNMQSDNLTAFPWGNDPNANLASGYFPWNISAPLRGSYSYDDLTESSFTDGSANAYRVIIDSNSSIMDHPLIDQIECWIRNGGIFITSGETGRHTPTGYDAWPIRKLSGYDVVHIDALGPGGGVQECRSLLSAPNQAVFPEREWKGVQANGLSLKKAAPDCQDLMLWNDGSVAVGERKLGKGAIIQVGCKFGGASLPDRLELAQGSPEFQRLHDLYSELLQAQHVPPAAAMPAAASTYSRHYVSNNGLYDIWTIWNEQESPVTSGIAMATDFQPATALEVRTGQPVSVAKSNGIVSVPDIHLDGKETRVFLTPRGKIESAPRDWFALQRHWWRGPTELPAHKFQNPAGMRTHTLDLSDDWAFEALQDPPASVAELMPGFDDHAWERRNLGIWSFPDRPQIHHALFRKAIQIPAGWNKGRITLWLQNWDFQTFHDKGSIYLDGSALVTESDEGARGFHLDLAPGSQHVLAVEIHGTGQVNGTTGQCWLSYVPDPSGVQDLSGDWQSSRDALHFEKVALPGHWDARLARRTITIDPHYAGKNVLVHYKGNAEVTGVIINGRWVRQDHHHLYNEWAINITPWVHFGQPNEIELARMSDPGTGEVTALSLDFYDPAVYP